MLSIFSRFFGVSCVLGVISILAPAHAVAQSDVAALKGRTEAKVNFGFSGGLHLSEVRTDGETSDRKGGFALGGHVEFPMGSRLVFVTEMLYSRKGTKESTAGLSLDLHYVDLSYLFRVGMPVTSSFETFVVMGPFTSFLVKADVSGAGVTVDVRDEFEHHDMGIVGGVGVRFPLEKSSAMLLSIRFQKGFTGILASEEIGEAASTNQSVAVHFGVSF